MLNQPGFFDLMDRANKLTKLGDPLVSLNHNINWEAFRLDLNTIRQKDRKSSAGAKANAQIKPRNRHQKPAENLEIIAKFGIKKFLESSLVN